MPMLRLNKKKKYIKICPKCKSPDIRMDKSTLQQLGALPAFYICNKCNYSGYNFPELEISGLNKFKEKSNKKHAKKFSSELVDTAYGKFEVRLIWKIESIAILLVGILLLFKEPDYEAGEKIAGIILILIGAFMFYITYFKKRKLKDD